MNPATATRQEFRIPDDLKELDQWVVWRNEVRNGSPTKVPYQLNGGLASSTNASTWSSFESAMECWHRFPRRHDGIGFVFSADDPYCGIDLDNCLDEQSNPKPWARPVLGGLFDSYTEISPSGRGVKIWVKARLPGPGRSKKERGEGIEIYDSARYFTVTGRVFNGAPLQIENHQQGVEKLYELIAGSKNGNPQAIGETIPHGQQHYTLTSLCGTMVRRGMCEEAIEAALLVVNARQCERPGPPENIRRLVRSARNWRRT